MADKEHSSSSLRDLAGTLALSGAAGGATYGLLRGGGSLATAAGEAALREARLHEARHLAAQIARTVFLPAAAATAGVLGGAYVGGSLADPVVTGLQHEAHELLSSTPVTLVRRILGKPTLFGAIEDPGVASKVINAARALGGAGGALGGLYVGNKMGLFRQHPWIPIPTGPAKAAADVGRKLTRSARTAALASALIVGLGGLARALTKGHDDNESGKNSKD